MLKCHRIVLVLLLYIVYNHPVLFKSWFLHYIYYTLIVFTALCELLSYIPSKNHIEYFRRVNGETCMIGIIILPIISASFSVMWHLNYLSFSVLALTIYFSFNFTKRYMVRVAYASMIPVIFIIYIQYTFIQTKPFTFLMFIYHLISLITFERIFHVICIYFSNTFTFSDTVVVSGLIYFIFEQCIVLNIACFHCLYTESMAQINYFKYRIIIHEYHIVSILIIGFVLFSSVVIIPFICSKITKNTTIHWLSLVLLIIILSIQLTYILQIRCHIIHTKQMGICNHSSLISVILDVIIGSTHYLILLYWIIVLYFFISITPMLTTNIRKIIIIRKYFHSWCLVLFLPIILANNLEFLSLAFSIALCLFIFVECIRITNFLGFGNGIEIFCRPFLDERDGGKLILTHVWLLIGCSLPLWYSFIKDNLSHFDNLNMNKIYGVSGIIILGIGDALAAIIGSKYGQIKWPNSNKTFEGTLAAIISSLLLYILMFINIIDTQMIFNLVQVITATFILEAITKQIDNLYLPLFCCLFIDITFVS